MRKIKIINEIFEFTFHGCCPYEIFFDEEQDECEKVKILCNCKKCKKDFKKCWLKYFENKAKERGKNG